MSDYILHNGELLHYGVKGMKWGVRRYQNADGSIKSAGKKRRLASARYLDDKKRSKRRVAQYVASTFAGGAIGSMTLTHLVRNSRLGLIPGSDFVSSFLGGYMGSKVVSELFFDDIGRVEEER